MLCRCDSLTLHRYSVGIRIWFSLFIIEPGLSSLKVARALLKLRFRNLLPLLCELLFIWQA
jgi:hypothetical protein